VSNTRSSVVVGDKAKKFFLRLWTWSTEWVPADQKGTIPLSSRREIRNLKKKLKKHSSLFVQSKKLATWRMNYKTP
jgi:hypothetical protein